MDDATRLSEKRRSASCKLQTGGLEIGEKTRESIEMCEEREEGGKERVGGESMVMAECGGRLGRGRRSSKDFIANRRREHHQALTFGRK